MVDEADMWNTETSVVHRPPRGGCLLGRLARSYPRQRKEGYYYETDDFHASPVSAQMKPCDQDWGKENLDVSGAVPLPENNCIIPYMWYPVNEKT